MGLLFSSLQQWCQKKPSEQSRHSLPPEVRRTSLPPSRGHLGRTNKALLLLPPTSHLPAEGQQEAVTATHLHTHPHPQQQQECIPPTLTPQDVHQGVWPWTSIPYGSWHSLFTCQGQVKQEAQMRVRVLWHHKQNVQVSTANNSSSKNQKYLKLKEKTGSIDAKIKMTEMWELSDKDIKTNIRKTVKTVLRVLIHSIPSFPY